jgi:tight adherence protein C
MNRILNYFYLTFHNLNYVGVLTLIFLSVSLAVMGVFFLLTRRNILQERMGRLLPEADASPTKKPKLLEAEQNGFVVKFTKPLQDVAAPKQLSGRRKIRLKLMQAGFRSEAAYRNYLAAKVFLAVLLPAIYLLSQFFFVFNPKVILYCFSMAAFGYFIPNILVLHFTQARQQRISKALPDALDLMVVCVEAGLGLDMTFKRVGDEIRPLCKDLSEEFQLTTLEIRAGKPRDESFKNMSLRTGVAEVNNLMTVLVQTSRFGTSMAKALRVHADAMRIKRRQLAEEKAAKSTVKLVFPLILFIFPALIIVLMGPAAIKIVKVLFPAMGG